MNACSQYAEMLALCASSGESPNPDCELHLNQCAPCRASLHDFREVCALQRRTADRLPEPALSPALDGWCLKQLTQRPSFARRLAFRSVLALCAFALALFLLMPTKLLHRESPTAHEAQSFAVLHPEGPTWKNLLQEIQSDRPLSRDQSGGPVVAQYRVKDAHAETD